MTESDYKIVSPGDAQGDRIWVEDDSGRRPFMRGIMVHSLMARGVSFDEAFGTANIVKERAQARGVVPRTELAKWRRESKRTSRFFGSSLRKRWCRWVC